MNTIAWKALAWVALRQTFFGLAVVALSLPPLFALSRALGLGTPPEEGLAILGGSVVLGFVGGGMIGGLLVHFSRAPDGRGAWRRLRLGAALAGLVWGLVLTSLALPVYLDGVVDDVTDAGTEAAIQRAGPVLDHPTGVLDQAWGLAGQAVQEGVARLPALTLLGWAVIGPALVAPLESCPRPRKDSQM